MTQPIRDIRADLKARLDLVGVRRQQAKEHYESELKEIKRDEEMLEALLSSEERLLAASRIVSERSWAQNALENGILDLLSNEGDWEHGEIKTALLDHGYGRGEDQRRFGQSIQGTLLSMSHRDLVQSAGYAKWKITKYGLTGEHE